MGFMWLSMLYLNFFIHKKPVSFLLNLTGLYLQTTQTILIHQEKKREEENSHCKTRIYVKKP